MDSPVASPDEETFRNSNQEDEVKIVECYGEITNQKGETTNNTIQNEEVSKRNIIIFLFMTPIFLYDSYFLLNLKLYPSYSCLRNLMLVEKGLLRTITRVQPGTELLLSALHKMHKKGKMLRRNPLK